MSGRASPQPPTPLLALVVLAVGVLAALAARWVDGVFVLLLAFPAVAIMAGLGRYLLRSGGRR